MSKVTRVSESSRDVAERVRAALESQDLDSFADLLAPDVRWGPTGDEHLGCHNRDEVLAWYRAGRERGQRARVVEFVVVEEHLLVGLVVSNVAAHGEDAGEVARWQVYTIRDDLVADIRGYDERSRAVAAARAELA